MFGRGVISAQYGWAFEKAGHTVEFYVRPGRIAKYGSVLPLKLLDARKKFKGTLIEEKWEITMREELSPKHDYDLIILSVQHYQFKEAAEFLSTRVSNATVLIFNNFWEDPLAQVTAFPKEQLAWGFPQAGGGFDIDGSLKGALFAEVQFGTFDTEPTDRELAVRTLFSNTGFKLTEHRDFKGWLWIHFAIEAGLFGKVVEVGSVEKVASSKEHVKNAILNVQELLPIVAARGIDMARHKSDIAFYSRKAWLAGFMLRMLVKISPPFKLLILSHNNPEEVKSYCQDVLAEAKHLKMRFPRLESIAGKL